MKVKEACNEVDVNIFVNNANFTFWNGAADDAALKRDGLRNWKVDVESVSPRIATETLQTPTPTTTPTRVKRNEPRPIAKRVAPDSILTVVKRRTRQSMGKCAKCGETNHVTATCRHPDKALCHVYWMRDTVNRKVYGAKSKRHIQYGFISH